MVGSAQGSSALRMKDPSLFLSHNFVARVLAMCIDNDSPNNVTLERIKLSKLGVDKEDYYPL